MRSQIKRTIGSRLICVPIWFGWDVTALQQPLRIAFTDVGRHLSYTREVFVAGCHHTALSPHCASLSVVLASLTSLHLGVARTSSALLSTSATLLRWRLSETLAGGVGRYDKGDMGLRLSVATRCLLLQAIAQLWLARWCVTALQRYSALRIPLTLER